MKTIVKAVIGTMLLGSTAFAQDDSALMTNGDAILTEASAPEHMEFVDAIYSGWRFRSAETQALQMDDFDNPGFIFIDQAIDLWDAVDGSEGKSCSSCHSDVEEFVGLRASLPRVEDGKLVTLEDLINRSRVEHMGAEPWKWSGSQMTAMTGLIGLQSRGMPIDVQIDGEAAAFWEQGKDIYYQRVGQLDMACANCHEDNYGVMIRADHLSQGQINGFPTYRLKNAKLNSIHGRFKGCMSNIRATPFAEGGDEFKALELYIASRGAGLVVETPSVRN
ncbi:sulfur oxidation c-type cytochrome SoxA [Cognatiyoonia sp.]|uniref:sulfur oxidation c-type cytochrome SoxA n=1 Tax=Cognatiyoonia sp. TaxID=2211652 RepID=UPI003F695533